MYHVGVMSIVLACTRHIGGYDVNPPATETSINLVKPDRGAAFGGKKQFGDDEKGSIQILHQSTTLRGRRQTRLMQPAVEGSRTYFIPYAFSCSLTFFSVVSTWLRIAQDG